MSEATRCRLYERDAEGKPTFKFRKHTDLEATFARIRRQMKEAEPAKQSNVKQLRTKGGK